jgi:hypothetical protein
MKKLSLILIIISLFVFTSCVSQNDYSKALNDISAANTQLNKLESQYNNLKYDYESLKAKYPLKDFKSVSEAENDGYKVWVNWDENDKTLTSGWVWMMTIINNNLYYWNYNEPIVKKITSITPER